MLLLEATGQSTRRGVTVRPNKIKEMWREGRRVTLGWLSVPNGFPYTDTVWPVAFTNRILAGVSLLREREEDSVEQLWTASLVLSAALATRATRSRRTGR